MTPPARHENLKNACIDEAFAIIEAKGVEKLSLREVARRLGVSHQAPYKHFPTRDHILAAAVARCYAEFAAFLEARPRKDDDWEDLGAMGRAYLRYAQENRLKYRLMFNSALPNPDDHPEMLAKAKHAFSLLHDKLSAMTLRAAPGDPPDPAKHDAVFIWSCLHGLASLMPSHAAGALPFTPEEREIAVERAMARLSLALEPMRA